MKKEIKNSVLFKSIISIWLIIFVGFMFIQYSTIHSHIYNGRIITHSHISGNSNQTTSDKNNPSNHKHSQDEFSYYAMIGLILMTIILVIGFLFISLHKAKSTFQKINFIQKDFVYEYFSLRAPPAL